MIQGLKVTLTASEVLQLITERVQHHEERAATYADEAQRMKAAKIEGMTYSGGDPIDALERRQQEHENSARELRFIGEHLDPSESYVLDRTDLNRLGITTSAY